VVLLPVGQAFTASTMHRPAGEGTAAIKGGVTFSIRPAEAKTVAIQLTPNGHTYECRNAAGAVSCPISDPPLAIKGADELNVIAY